MELQERLLNPKIMLLLQRLLMQLLVSLLMLLQRLLAVPR